jgi:opacity protein-like surface antigen
MKAEKDLGKLIRERLADTEVAPESNLWNAIEKSLERKRKRRLGFLWSLGLLLLLLGAFSVLRFSHEPKIQELKQHIKNTDTRIQLEDSVKTHSSDGEKKGQPFPQALEKNKEKDDAHSLSTNKDSTQGTSSQNPKIGLSEVVTGKQEPASEENPTEVDGRRLMSKSDGENDENERSIFPDDPILDNTSDKSNPDAEGTITTNTEKKPNGKTNQSDGFQWNGTVSKSEGNVAEKKAQENPFIAPNKIEGATSKSDKKSVEKTTKKDSLPLELPETQSQKKYYIYPFLSSSSYGGLSRASAIDERLDGNPRSNNLSYGYGLYFVFKPNEKWGIRIGAAYSHFEKSTFDVPIRPNDLSTNYYRDISFQNNLSYLTLSNTFSQPESITLQERLSYLQVPLEVTRVLLKRGKFGIDAIAGMGVIYLKRNEITVIRTTGTAIELGKNDNYSEGSFGIHFGFGLDYELNQSLKIQLEPIIKPQIGFYEKGIGNRPFIFNIQLGVLYRL